MNDLSNKPERPQNKHLIPAKKGEIRNPYGKSINGKGKSISTYLKEILEKKIPPHLLNTKTLSALGIKGIEKLNQAQLTAMMLVAAQFYKFNPTQLNAISEILDRTEGKPLQKNETKLELESPDIKVFFDGEDVKFTDRNTNEVPSEPAI